MNSVAELKGTDPLSQFLPGGAAAIGTFQRTLNDAAGFKEDGLSLEPGAVPATGTVANQLDAIVTDYHRRGWEVV
ncbi:MAG: hypothetical protein AAF718_08505 [Pseudomonadota bacterium]